MGVTAKTQDTAVQLVWTKIQEGSVPVMFHLFCSSVIVLVGFTRSAMQKQSLWNSASYYYTVNPLKYLRCEGTKK